MFYLVCSTHFVAVFGRVICAVRVFYELHLKYVLISLKYCLLRSSVRIIKLLVMFILNVSLLIIIVIIIIIIIIIIMKQLVMQLMSVKNKLTNRTCLSVYCIRNWALCQCVMDVRASNVVVANM